jgi:hypothetical protein
VHLHFVARVHCTSQCLARHYETRAAYATNQARTHTPTPNSQSRSPSSYAWSPVFLRFLHHARIFSTVLCCIWPPLLIVTRYLFFLRLPFARQPVAASSFVPLPPNHSIAPSLSSTTRHTTPSHSIILAGTTNNHTRSHVVGCAIADSWPSSPLNQRTPIP